MDYSVLSLIELKQHAKKRKIKQYYIRPKEELVTLLSMPQLPESFQIEKKTIQQLRTEAQARGIKTGIWRCKRKDLVALLYSQDTDKTASDEYQKDQRDTYEHDDPENHHSE
jgi:hypothetical protein